MGTASCSFAKFSFFAQFKKMFRNRYVFLFVFNKNGSKCSIKVLGLGFFLLVNFVKTRQTNVLNFLKNFVSRKS